MFGNDESDVIFDAVGSRIPYNQDLAHILSFAEHYKCLCLRFFLLITLRKIPFYISNEELTKAKQIIARHSSCKSDIVWANLRLLL